MPKQAPYYPAVSLFEIPTFSTLGYNNLKTTEKNSYGRPKVLQKLCSYTKTTQLVETNNSQVVQKSQLVFLSQPK